MRSVQRAEDVFESDIRAFPALISAFLYCDLDKGFREFVQVNWESLSALSHRELLMLVPEMRPSLQVPQQNKTRLIRPFHRLTRKNRQSTVITVSDHFKIDISDFPCMIFFRDPRCREVYCFSFADGASEMALSRDIKNIFGKCRDIVRVRGELVDLDENAIIDERAAMLTELVPQLRMMKIFRSFRKFLLSDTVNKALSIGSKVAQTV